MKVFWWVDRSETADPLDDLMNGRIDPDEYFRRVRRETDEVVRREFKVRTAQEHEQAAPVVPRQARTT